MLNYWFVYNPSKINTDLTITNSSNSVIFSNLGEAWAGLPIPEKTDGKSFYHFFPMKTNPV